MALIVNKGKNGELCATDGTCEIHVHDGSKQGEKQEFASFGHTKADDRCNVSHIEMPDESQGIVLSNKVCAKDRCAENDRNKGAEGDTRHTPVMPANTR